MNEISIINNKLPEGFFKSYSEIKLLELDEMPSVNVLNAIISGLEHAPRATVKDAAIITRNLASCFPSYAKYEDALIEGLIEQFVEYPIEICQKAYKELRDNSTRMPTIKDVRDMLKNVDSERVRPMNVATMYLSKIARTKPKGVSATPDQIKQMQDKLT
jgi:hypothetical protein